MARWRWQSAAGILGIAVIPVGASGASFSGSVWRLTSAPPAAFREVCAKQNALTPVRARTCPPLVPGGRMKVVYGGGFDAELGSPSLNELGGRHIETNGEHWATRCGGPASHVRRGMTIVLGGHIACVWAHSGVTYLVSAHGYANEPRVAAISGALIRKVLVTR